MSEAKHTPGPWCVDTTNAFGAYGVWTDYVTHPGHDGAGYGSQICSVLTHAFELTDKTTRAARDANACLIAAAPDLLHELICSHDRSILLLHHHCTEACPIRAAINKATGTS